MSDGSQQMPSLEIQPGTVARWLLSMTAILVVSGGLANYALYNLVPDPDHPLGDVLKRFDLGHEPSIPNFYSASLMLLIAYLMFLLGIYDHRLSPRSRRNWLGLGILFVGLAIDENVMFHEMATALLDHLNLSGPFYFSWVIPGGLFAGLVGLVFLRFLLSLGRRSAGLMIAAGIVFVSGAIGMETVAGVIFAAAENELEAQRSVAHVVVQAIEEGLEMSGLVLWVYAALDYAKRTQFRLMIIGTADQPAASPAAQQTGARPSNDPFPI